MNGEQVTFIWEMAGEGPVSVSAFRYRAHGDAPRVLQVAIHGNSYDHRYWDAGTVNGRDYSYADFMTARGYDVLAFDLPGTGASSRPPGDKVSLEWVAENLASSIEGLRADDARGAGLISRVALVGHSLGTIVSVYMQARWPIADLLVATGTGYLPGEGVSSFGAGVRDAAMSEPYASLPPDERRKAFYHQPMTDPAVIDFDNRKLRNEMPRRLWTDCLDARADLPASGVEKISCPVLIQLGEYDQVLLGRHLDAERRLWTGAVDVVLDHVDDVGHCFNLHLNHENGWRAIDRFLRR